MNDLLFQVPATGPTAIQSARARLAAAQAAYDKSSELEDDTGEPMPSDVRRELRDAQRAVAKAENDEVEMLRQANQSPGPHVAESDQ